MEAENAVAEIQAFDENHVPEFGQEPPAPDGGICLAGLQFDALQL